jgi:hypothetical protein
LLLLLEMDQPARERASLEELRMLLGGDLKLVNQSRVRLG